MKLFLLPKLRFDLLGLMLRCCLAGALFSAIYGIVHDEITYSISHEYFTRLKFIQFGYANFGFPPRVFVAEVGVLATWWVGFIAGWFIARVTAPSLPRKTAFRCTLRGFAIMFATALAGSVCGYIYGLTRGGDFSSWDAFRYSYHVEDLPSFVRVAYIHNASYLGGLAGLVAALIYARKRCRAEQRAR
jgi:hypothetical protein